MKLLEKRHGRTNLLAHAQRNESVQEKVREYDQQASRGESTPIYQFGEGVLEGQDINLTDTTIQIPGFEQPIELNVPNAFSDMTD